MDTMQKRLNAMRVPAAVCRLLNKWASNMSHLTGHQVKAFVGCFSLAVYAGFLAEKELELWNYLVIASRLLSQHAIALVQVDQVFRSVFVPSHCQFLSLISCFVRGTMLACVC